MKRINSSCGMRSCSASSHSVAYGLPLTLICAELKVPINVICVEGVVMKRKIYGTTAYSLCASSRRPESGKRSGLSSPVYDAASVTGPSAGSMASPFPIPCFYSTIRSRMAKEMGWKAMAALLDTSAQWAQIGSKNFENWVECVECVYIWYGL